MKRYTSFSQAYVETLLEILSRGDLIDAEKSFIELQGHGFVLTNPFDRLIWNGARDTNYEFAMKMFLWILSGSEDAEYLTGINPNSKQYLSKEKGGKDAPTFVTAYGPRLAAQLSELLRELEIPGTRKATALILRSEDSEYRQSENIEYPCTESITLSIRRGQLNCHVNMRSNNMVTTVVYDVFVFTMLQEYILRRLNHREEVSGADIRTKMGAYFHYCVSAHIFTHDVERANAIASESGSYPHLRRFDKK